MRYVLALLAMLLCSTASADEAKRVFTTAAPSTVSIVDELGGAGSGTVIAIDGDYAEILTCYHVIAGVKTITVNYDAEGKRIISSPGVVVRKDPGHDLAIVMALNPQHRPAAAIADAEPELYDELYTVSSPIGLQRQSAIERLNTKDMRYGWTFSGESIPGMSGGAIVDHDAKIVCVLKATMQYNDDVYPQMGYCIPLSVVRAFLKGLTK